MHIKITNPEDFRIKKGAKFQWEKETTRIEGVGEYTRTVTTKVVQQIPFVVDDDIVSVSAIRNSLRNGVNDAGWGTDLYLIEEAPDTDKEFREALADAMHFGIGSGRWFNEAETQRIIDHLRKHGARFNG